MNKKVVNLGMIFGSILGGYIPTLWGSDAFSLSSVLCAALGGILGIYLSFKLLD